MNLENVLSKKQKESSRLMKKISVIPGDGIGPEVIKAAVKVLDKACPKEFEFVYVSMGGNAIDKFGVPLPDESLKTCKESDATL
ncbi:MAG: hypothetical protein IJQ57_13055, partial [Synergistaceae bacterium]|nr:hypothetical protein [Synergistaceae bacterium]